VFAETGALPSVNSPATEKSRAARVIAPPSAGPKVSVLTRPLVMVNRPSARRSIPPPGVTSVSALTEERSMVRSPPRTETLPPMGPRSEEPSNSPTGPKPRTDEASMPGAVLLESKAASPRPPGATLTTLTRPASDWTRPETIRTGPPTSETDRPSGTPSPAGCCGSPV
jgi:hypothetical protein